MESAIAYYRVSTRQQQRSGLGIEAQRATVARFAEAEGLTVISEFVEAETGKGAEALDRRPQLAAALAAAKIAKCCGDDLHRLSRHHRSRPLLAKWRILVVAALAFFLWPVLAGRPLPAHHNPLVRIGAGNLTQVKGLSLDSALQGRVAPPSFELQSAFRTACALAPNPATPILITPAQPIRTTHEHVRCPATSVRASGGGRNVNMAKTAAARPS